MQDPQIGSLKATTAYTIGLSRNGLNSMCCAESSLIASPSFLDLTRPPLHRRDLHVPHAHFLRSPYVGLCLPAIAVTFTPCLFWMIPANTI